MKIQLELRPSRGQPIVQQIEKATITIGSGAGCEFGVVGEGLEFSHVAENHCRIELTPDSASLIDLGSDKGTWINGRSVQQPMAIRAGTRFKLGRLGPTVTVRSIDLSVPRPEPKPAPPKPRSRKPMFAGIAALLVIAAGLVAYFGDGNFNPGEFVGGDGDHFAIVIAVEDYPDTQPIADLEYAEEDAVRIARALHENGYEVSLMVQSLDDEEHLNLLQPTKANIRNELKKVFNDGLNLKLDGNDTVTLIVIGQSVHFESGSAGQEGSLFFCPSDADVVGLETADQVSVENNLIALDDFYAALGEPTKANVRFFYLDTARFDPANLPDPETVQVKTLPELPRPPGDIVALFSSEPGQQSHIDATTGFQAGVSSEFLARALAGGAGEDALLDRQLTFAEIGDFVAKNTSHHVATYLKGLRQQPRLEGADSRLGDVLVRFDSQPTSQPVASSGTSTPLAGPGPATVPGIVSVESPGLPQAIFEPFGPPTEAAPEHGDLAKRTYDFLNKYCVKCHSDDQESSLSKILDRTSLLAESDGGGPYLVPGDPEKSMLWIRAVKQDEDFGDSMPPPENEAGVPIPSDEERNVLQEWILAGAPALPAPAASDVPELALKARGFFDTYCFSCHGGDKKLGGLTNVLSHSLLTTTEKKGKLFVAAGNPSESLVWSEIASGEMPKKSAAAQPGDAERAFIEQWIAAGAPNWEQVKLRPQISQRYMMTAMVQDMRKLSSTQRKDRRYLSVVHLHNNSFGGSSARTGARPDTTPHQLRLVRAAASKMINSLTWRKTITVPQPLDSHQSILAINLSDYGWTSDDWQKLVVDYPYGLRLDAHPEPDLADAADELFRLSGTQLPFIHADWFVNNAARPAFYYDVLDLPDHISKLEKNRLEVDPFQDFLDGRIARAGFTQSGVSNSNRLVDRHETRVGPNGKGYYWKSYDFAKSDNKGSLNNFPLGPVVDSNPFSEFAFEADGGEMIFTLPNGMQGYYLSTIDGQRLCEGPVEVVRDKDEISGSTKVVNAISCMFCHARGMFTGFKDTIRDGSSMTGDALRKVQELYVPEDTMIDILAKDEQLFMKSALKATSSFLNPDEAASQDPEPIGTVARYIFQQELGLEEAAAELHVSPEKFRASIELTQAMRDLDLAELADKGGVIQRSVWESRTGEGKPSVFQQAARLIHRLEPVITSTSLRSPNPCPPQ